jgi:hypothetical protein
VPKEKHLAKKTLGKEASLPCVKEWQRPSLPSVRKEHSAKKILN